MSDDTEDPRVIKMNPDQRWHLTYRVDHHPEGLTADEVAAKGPEWGACDNLIFVSIILPKDGGYSQYWHGTRGKTEEDMTSDEIFKAWVLMADSLAQKADLSEGRRELCKTVWDVFCEATFGKVQA